MQHIISSHEAPHLCMRRSRPGDPTSQSRCAGSRGTAIGRLQGSGLAQAPPLGLRLSAAQLAELQRRRRSRAVSACAAQCTEHRGDRASAERLQSADLVVGRSPRWASCAVRWMRVVENRPTARCMSPPLLAAESDGPTPEDMCAPQEYGDDDHSCQGVAAKQVVATLQGIRPWITRILNEHARSSPVPHCLQI